MADESFTDGTRVPSNGNNPCRKTEGVDLISSLPDSILQHILSFIPTKLAIRASLLSKRWRHVWCDIPSLSLDDQTLKATSITLNRFTSLKIMNFHLNTTMKQNIPHINKWVEFAISRNVENLSLDFWNPSSSYKFEIPDFFYVNSSVKQLTIKLSFTDLMVPACSLSWTSLKKLYLRNCNLSDESMAKILSGIPLLESLTLYFCNELRVLDLSKSLRLRTLKINRNIWVPGPTHIVAPHIYRLRLRNSQLPCTFVDLSSLAEARLDICIVPITQTFKADFLQDMVLKMLEKLQNVEKLTFGGNFLHIISLVEVCGVRFPMFKVKDLTLETVIFQYVIPGIERLLQNSPNLKKLTIRARDTNTIREEYINNYLKLHGLDPDQCWRSKDGVVFNKFRWYLESKHATSFVELVLKNTKTLDLDKIVILLNERYLRFKFEELVVPTLSHNNFSMQQEQRVKRPFKFTSALTTVSGYQTEIEKVWKTSEPLFHSTSAMHRLSKKLKGLKPHLRKMGKELLGDISKRTKAAYKKMCDLQAATMSNPSSQSVESEADAYERWIRLSDIEERYLRQKAKLHWMDTGDQNNKVFYNAAKIREVRNNIREIQCEDGQIATDQQLIKKEAERYFKDFLLFKPLHYVDWSREELENLLEFRCNEDDKTLLTKEVSTEEVKKVLFSMPGNKSPGPDGYTCEFYKETWSTVGNDFVVAIHEVNQRRASTLSPNTTMKCLYTTYHQQDTLLVEQQEFLKFLVSK